MNLFEIILLLIVILGLLAIIYASIYNNLVNYKLKIDKAEGIIDESLRQKYDIIAKLNIAIKKVVTKKDYLKEYLESQIISDYVEKKYQELSEILSLKDADLRAIGKEAQSKGTNTLIVSDNVFKFLENYGFNIVSLDEENLTEGTLNSIKNNFKKETYTTILVLDNNYTENIKTIVNDYKAKTIDVKSMINVETDNTDDYLTVMQDFIDNIENICIS